MPTSTEHFTWMRVFRETQDKTQRDLRDAVGISQGAVSKYESGQRVPTVAVARKIARELNTTVEALWPDDGSSPMDLLTPYVKQHTNRRKRRV